ncbi:MAG: hypothetical protein RM338_22365 [Nostoc sp. DedQUE12a]|nr:hypothetical protein [Nostoc sp. DedQUE12a]
MNNINSEITPNNQEPDPAWDYYPLWHSLHHIKAKIDVALKLISTEEHATIETDKTLRAVLDPPSDKLVSIISELPYEEE